MYNKPCCYFYIENDGTVAYVGKANGTLRQRVRAHSKEDKFDCAHTNYTIKYIEFDRASDMDVAEKCYIKSLKPRLNVIDNTDGFFPEVIIDFSKLCEYSNVRQVANKKHVVKDEYGEDVEECVYPLNPFEVYKNTLDSIAKKEDILFSDDEEYYITSAAICYLVNEYHIGFFSIGVFNNRWSMDASKKMVSNNAFAAKVAKANVNLIVREGISTIFAYGTNPMVAQESAYNKWFLEQYGSRIEYANSFDENVYMSIPNVYNMCLIQNNDEICDVIDGMCAQFSHSVCGGAKAVKSEMYKLFDSIVQYPKCGDSYKAEDCWDYTNYKVKHITGGRIRRAMEWEKLKPVMIYCALRVIEKHTKELSKVC